MKKLNLFYLPKSEKQKHEKGLKINKKGDEQRKEETWRGVEGEKGRNGHSSHNQ